MTSFPSERKKKIFSPGVFEQVKALVHQGMSPKEIANHLGCTLGTLRVKCSQHQITLRRNQDAAAEPRNGILRIRLSEHLAVRLHSRSRQMRVSHSKFAAQLIEAIVQDNLYDAVIDPGKK
jgi:metal-dependent amidase/aminoacylase/carboxypeptidase family protein